MSEQSNAFVFAFASGVCLVCGLVVAGSVVALKDRQEANKLLDRQKKVLSVAGIIEEKDPPSPEKIAELYQASIEAHVVHLEDGKEAADVDPATFDQRAASLDPARSEVAPKNAAQVGRLPENALVYHVLSDGKVDKLILPIEGKGLWSTLYGFIALERDTNTIAGITFYEHGETPGLGGEVDNPLWKGLWKGRKAFGPNGEPKIEVIKGVAGSAAESPYAVDGLSGATITSRGVTHLVQFWLDDHGYGPYLEQFRKKNRKGGA